MVFGQNQTAMTRVALRFGLVAALGVSLSACQSMSRALGLEKVSPDEFAIMTRAPLILPPDFNLLPPKPGQRRPQDLPSSQVAAAALYDSYDRKITKPLTQGENALLARVGASQASPAIRAVLAAESGATPAAPAVAAAPVVKPAVATPVPAPQPAVAVAPASEAPVAKVVLSGDAPEPKPEAKTAEVEPAKEAPKAETVAAPELKTDMAPEEPAATEEVEEAPAEAEEEVKSDPGVY